MLKRTHERTRTLIPAQITRSGRVLDCVVRDLSAGGARLRVADGGAVPQEFELFLKQTGEYRPARVRWRRPTEVGIAFMHERRSFGRRATPPPAPGR